MVFERAFQARWIEKKPSSTFLITAGYTLLAIVSARLIFKANSGIMGVAFLAVLLSHALNQLMRDLEKIEVKETGKFSLRRLLKDHDDIFQVYFFLFFAVFVVYFIVAMIVPPGYAQSLFREQLGVLGNLTGGAVSDGSFLGILANNIKVLIVVFLLSFVYGAGAILLIVWNASVWGSIFGFVFAQQVFFGPLGFVKGFLVTMLPFFPHIIIEAMSYLAVAISGGVLSKAMLSEKWNSRGFHHVITDGIIFLGYAFILVILGAYVETHVVPLFIG